MYKKIIPLLLLYFIYYDCYSQAILNPPSVIPKDVIRTNTLKAGTNIVITYQGYNTYINTSDNVKWQAPNTVFAGPASGDTNAEPTFRTLVSADFPAGISAAKISDGIVDNTEFNFLDGLTSRAADSRYSSITNVTLYKPIYFPDFIGDRAIYVDVADGMILKELPTTRTDLLNLYGTKANIQDQLDIANTLIVNIQNNYVTNLNGFATNLNLYNVHFPTAGEYSPDEGFYIYNTITNEIATLLINSKLYGDLFMLNEAGEITLPNYSSGDLYIDVDKKIKTKTGITNIYNDSKGWVGISNTTPQATLDVAGGIRAQKGVSCDVNFETLTADKTLTAGVDAQYQYLNPNGANRTVYLPSDAKNGDMFFIKNTVEDTSSYRLQIYDSTQSAEIDRLYTAKGKRYIFGNGKWNSVEDYKYGEYSTALGYNANGANSGAAVGAYVNGTNSGAAMGYGANGANYGAAVGRSANGTNSGAAMGYVANGANYGAAVGRDAKGANYGTAMGYGANGADFGAAVGRAANGTNYGAAVGRDAKGANYSAGIGYSTGYRIVNGKTNILIGNIAGYNEDVNAITNGNYNLLVGNGAGLPSDCSYYLNIGNAIFGTNVQTKTGTNIDVRTKIGIATNEPNYTLEVHGDIGLAQHGNLYKGGEKLGWYSTGTFSQYGTTSITFPVTNAVYKIEGWGQAQSNETNITASSAGIYYGASDTQDKIVNIRMASAAGSASDQAILPFYFADIVEVNLESERVNYWKIKASGGVGVTVSGYYILTRIR